MKKYTLFLIILLSSCSSIPVEQVNDRLQAWKNSDIDQIIKYWGVPTKKQEVNGIYYAEWLNKESEKGNAAVSIGTGSRSRHSSFGFGLTLFDLGGTDDVCSRIVTYNETGKVVKIIWKGTKDFCYELTPDKNTIIPPQ